MLQRRCLTGTFELCFIEIVTGVLLAKETRTDRIARLTLCSKLYATDALIRSFEKRTKIN